MISPNLQEKMDALLATYPQRRSALLPVLHLWQEEYGYISQEGVIFLAEQFGLSPAQVFETVTFYHMFRTKPAGRYVFQVCTNISCMLRGSGEILQALRGVLGIEVGQTTPDGRFTLLETECLAACGGAPVVQLNEEYLERLDCDRIREIVAQLKAKDAQGEPA